MRKENAPEQLITQREALKKLGAIGVGIAATAIGIEKEGYARESVESKKKLPLPKITFQDEERDRFTYRNAFDTKGRRISDRPEEGELVYFRHSASGKESTVLRKIVHELIHQQFDHLNPENQEKIKRLCTAQYGKEMEKFMKDQDPTYEIKIEKITKEQGEAAAHEFVINEFIAHVLAYEEIPVEQPKSIKEHFDPEVWEAAVKEAGSEEALIKELSDHPDLLPPYQISHFYDTNERTYFELQERGLSMNERFILELVKYGIGGNKERAQEVLARIRIAQSK